VQREIHTKFVYVLTFRYTLLLVSYVSFLHWVPICLGHLISLLRHAIWDNFPLERPKSFLLLKIKWNIVAACVVEMQLCENSLHHPPVPPGFCEVLHAQTLLHGSRVLRPRRTLHIPGMGCHQLTAISIQPSERALPLNIRQQFSLPSIHSSD